MTSTAERIQPAPSDDVNPVADPQTEALPLQASSQTLTDQPGQPPRKKKRRSLGARLLMGALPLALVIAGAWFYLTGGRYISTDNAYVIQALVPVSSDIAGRIVSVAVVQNQQVTEGDILFKLDPIPFDIALNRAEAEVEQARVTVAGLRTANAVAEAELVAASRALEIRRVEYDRQAELREKGVVTPATLDETRLSLNAAESQVEVARKQLAQAVAALGGDPDIETDDVPSVRAALANEEAARRDRGHAVVVAPADGTITQIGNLNVGQFVQAGAMAVSMVATDDTWIEANFKETQLEHLAEGQPVTVEVDAYPGYRLSGHVQSFSNATGSQLSLLPAQNATGNWVKVVQRLPVRIAITPEAGHPLRNGMSVTATVDTGATRLDRMW